MEAREMEAQKLDDLEFEERLSRRLAAFRQESADRLDSISEEAALWFALCPAWTPSLADTVAFPRAPGHSVHETLLRFRDAGACQHRAALPREAAAAGRPGAADLFWMTEPTRSEVVRRAISARGREGVLSVLQDVGARVRRAAEAADPGPDVRRWAVLAEAAAPVEACARALLDEVEESLVMNRPNEALRWIDAARLLEDLIGTWLTAAAGHAGRMVERYHRRADDEARLAHFFERREQLEAFDALMRDPGDAWALHYLGPGGVGKTMLMRHITARLVPRLDASAARVDFDYVNPDYPTRAPGLLLSLLAAELRLFDRDESGNTAEAFESFDLRALTVRESAHEAFERFDSALAGRAARESAGPLDAASAIAAGALDDLVLAFVDAVQILPQPLLLLLDTCEELAKHRTEAGPSPNVEATFALLERVQEVLRERGLPLARVVFCGRRPLASKGAGWRLVEPADARRLAERPYLRLHQVQGFTKREARAFFAKHAARPVEGGRPLRPARSLVDAVLRRSPAVGLGFGIAQRGPTAATCRYSPIDLARFAAWIREEGDVDPDDLATLDAHRYVAVRIAGRLRSAVVRDLLPLVGALGCFDREMLLAAGLVDEARLAEAFDDLCHQEWIHVRPPRLAEVEPGIAPRLREYAHKEGGAALDAALARVAAHLAERTLSAPLEQLDPAHFAIALRLTRDPDRAAAWWNDVEARLTREGAFDWARRLTDRLLTDRDRLPFAGAPHDRIVALVQATYSGALLHCAGVGTDTLWDAIEAYLAGEDGRDDRLRARAAAGLLVTAWAKGEPLDSERLRALERCAREAADEALDEALAAALVAGFEAALEIAERDPGAPVPDALTVERLAHVIGGLELSTALRAFSCVLAARAHAHARSGALGQILVQLTDAACIAGSAGELGGRWLDWVPPDDIGSLVLLELARIAYPNHAPADDVERWLAAGLASRTPGSLAFDRSASALLFLRDAQSVPSGSIDPPARPDKERSARRPGSVVENAVAAFPSSAVQRWLAIAGQGRIADALGGLAEQRRRSESSALELADVRAASAATLTITRRLRLWDEGRRISSRDELASGDDFALRCALEGLHGRLHVASRLDQAGLRLAYMHALWRAVGPSLATPEKRMIQWFSDRAALPPRTGEEAAALLDLAEASQLTGGDVDAPIAGVETALARFCNERRAGVAEVLTLRLRSWALFGAEVAPPADLAPLVTQVGKRRAGWLALEEGELLALRLPSRAPGLCNFAAGCLHDSGDWLGYFIACTALATVFARAGSASGCEGAVARLHDVYPAVAPQLGLPAWEVVESLARDASAEGVEGLPQLLRPWLLRLSASMAWANDRRSPGDRLETLHRAIEARGALPFEMRSWKVAPERAPAGGLQQEAGDLERARIMAQGRRAPAAAGRREDDDLRRAMVVAPADDAGVHEAMSRVADVILSGVTFRASSDELGRQGSLRQWDASFHCSAAFGLDEALTWSIRYQEVRRGELPPPRPSFIPIGAVQGIRTVELHLAPAAAAPEWELHLARWLEEGLTRPVHEIGFVRRPDEGRSRLRGAPGFLLQECLSLVQGSQQFEMAERGWAPLRAEAGRFQIENFSEKWRDASTTLHFVAEPFDTGYGARLTPRSEETLERLKQTRGESLDAEVLLQRFPNVALVVLQAPPGRTSGWSEVRRDSAAHLREIAMDLTVAGVVAVITIPTLPRNTAIAALRALAERLPRANYDPEELIGAVAAVRERVLELEWKLAPYERLGVAMDIALYLNDLGGTDRVRRGGKARGET
ncbi:hypothetical protein [Sorangium sp. So ce1000]|uniref:hypothetical protein n=1 Tax=Sorangium sp. So ce1000 TaxID=3133325 RepID=UPI003F613939